MSVGRAGGGSSTALWGAPPACRLAASCAALLSWALGISRVTAGLGAMGRVEWSWVLGTWLSVLGLST